MNTSSEEEQVNIKSTSKEELPEDYQPGNDLQTKVESIIKSTNNLGRHTKDVSFYDSHLPGENGEPQLLSAPSAVPPNDGDVILNRSKSTQALIESLRNNRITEDKKYSDGYETLNKIELLPVDWLGLPLAPSTLPDFVSTTKLHYKRPLTSKNYQLDRSVPVLDRDRSNLPGNTFHDQFLDVDWVSSNLYQKGIAGGYSKKEGQLAEVIPHPKTSIWDVPEAIVDRIRKKDPMEYLNLLDPSNIISTEKAIYKWLIRDQSEVGLEATIGPFSKSSGFLWNRLPHIPPVDERDFRSIYKRSFCDSPMKNEVEGLIYPANQPMKYPGYGGGRTMRDFPSSFIRFGSNVLKNEPNFARKNYRRAMSAKPVP